MQHPKPDDRVLEYERKMQALYAEDAAAKFKQEFWPADPFETGVVVNSSDLSIEELVQIYKAVEFLHSQGNEAFLNSLILHRGHLNLPPMVRINPLWVDARRQRTVQVSNLLHSWHWETSQSFEKELQEIVGAGDPQLIEYVRQVEEALNVSWLSLMPVSVTVVGESPTMLIE
jgi:hypothetical protein